MRLAARQKSNAIMAPGPIAQVAGRQMPLAADRMRSSDSLTAIATDVGCASFQHRSSTRAAQDIGRKISARAVNNVMQPPSDATR